SVWPRSTVSFPEAQGAFERVHRPSPALFEVQQLLLRSQFQSMILNVSSPSSSSSFVAVSSMIVGLPDNCFPISIAMLLTSMSDNPKELSIVFCFLVTA